MGAFTQSSAKETLQKTLQSIKLPSDPERTLYDEQRDLANIEETKREQERVLEAKKCGFLVIMQQMTAMQVEVDRMKSRKADKEKLAQKFHMFTPKYIDYYDSSFRNEGSEFRWTFTGTKD